MRVLGIDPGTIITGYGVVEGEREGLVALGWGSIRPRGVSLPVKLRTIFEGLREVIVKFKPEVVALESVFYAKNVVSSLKLGCVRGISLLTASLYEVEVVEYTPLQVKQALVGYGRANKEQIQKMVSFLLKIDAPFTYKDIADALALAICHLHTYKWNSSIKPV